LSHILSKFEILGLHGYKNLRLEFCGQTTIVVAENGTGKTTLLNALNNVLNGEMSDLFLLDFKKINISFSDGTHLTLNKEFIGVVDNSEFKELYQFIEDDMPESELEYFIKIYEAGEFRDHPVYTQLYGETPFSHDELNTNLLRAKKNFSSGLVDEGIKFVSNVKEKLAGIEVIYLPTYRRVEKIFKRNPIKNNRHDEFSKYRRGIISGFENSPRGAGPRRKRRHDEIAFGLSDVEKTLRDISEQIERRSNVGYRNLSTTMLEDLLTGNNKQHNLSGELPDIEDLSRFLGRVENQNRPRSKTDIFKGIEDQYKNNKIDKNHNLKYFLTKLQNVIASTKELEFMIESFVSICNEYLKNSSDSKHLIYDAKTLNVLVFDEFTQKNIKLDDLSSGEKQIISLMSILYLDKSNKIILIDEPELSLSLEWQKKVLPDIINSGSVVQLLAITHSPFVFDNELDLFTRDLLVEKVK